MAVFVYEPFDFTKEFGKAKWEAVSKGLERLHKQIGIIAELRRMGFDSATI